MASFEETSTGLINPLAEAKKHRRVRLVFHHAGGTETVELSTGEEVVVGRHHTSHVVIDDSALSRRHARFCWDGTALWVEDLDSTNGTKVGGRLIQQLTEVGENDLAKMGSVRAVYQEVDAPRRSALVKRNQVQLVFEGARMQELMRTVSRVAVSDIPVLIHGETGSGKELVARSIHAQSERSQGPMIAVNCAAIPASLIESTLFGHERGAFTGATDTAKGVFEEGIGGTVFLDEIAELSPASQAALLRTLELKCVTRVGSRKEIPVDTRIIAASHRDLEEMVDAGEFRRDLLYRLNAIVVEVPALRERREDIEALVDHFLSAVCERQNRDLTIEPIAMDALTRYDWPGNVRELRNEVERACVVVERDIIRLADLSGRVRRVAAPRTVVPRADETAKALVPMLDPELLTFPEGDPISGIRAVVDEDLGFKQQVKDYERALLLDAYQRAEGNQSEAARILKMPIRTFNHKFRAHGLHDIVESTG